MTVVFAGEELRADKDWVRGTHRAMDPALTLARIRPHLSKAGITRIADITDLDTLEVPVAVAIRPASGTLTVEGGKGITRDAAFTSAAMEGIERYVAEEALVVDLDATVPEVADRLPVPRGCLPDAAHGQRLRPTPLRVVVDEEPLHRRRAPGAG